MQILHVSAECYPAAKAGGLGDVVGALPKYLPAHGLSAGVIIPKYDTPWIQRHRFTTVYHGTVRMHQGHIPFTIEQEVDNTLGFPFFVANIPGKYDRPGIYLDPYGHGYGDEVERALSFQQAVLQWIVHSPGRPRVLHCHDHHTALIPFFIKYSPAYQSLAQLPTVLTIHNGQYHGAFSWDRLFLLPFFSEEARGLLGWHQHINSLATGIKTAWRVTTVSPSYLLELTDQANGMESLIRHEWHKCVGILNGIDAQVWDPATDTYIAHQREGDELKEFKNANKSALAEYFPLDLRLPLVTFIGRLVGEKGADLFPDLIRRVLYTGLPLSFAFLGTGEPWLHQALGRMNEEYPGRFYIRLEYNEKIAHQLYAGADFLLMPSRVEPCGLNQMYAMRYGTVPIVRAVGGLRDTVPDIGEPDGRGRGIQFTNFNLEDAHIALYRAVELYRRPERLDELRKHIQHVDFSWERAAGQYAEIYREVMW